VLAVGLVVGDIVEKVEGRGDEREGAGHQEGHKERLPTAHEVLLGGVRDREEPRDHHDAIFCPLVNANRAKPRFQSLIVCHLMSPQKSECVVRTGFETDS
jgi:hypothetical protein